MLRAERNIAERRNGLLKAVFLPNGEQEVLYYGSTGNVGISYQSLIDHCSSPLVLHSGLGKECPLVSHSSTSSEYAGLT